MLPTRNVYDTYSSAESRSGIQARSAASQKTRTAGPHVLHRGKGECAELHVLATAPRHTDTSNLQTPVLSERYTDSNCTAATVHQTSRVASVIIDCVRFSFFKIQWFRGAKELSKREYTITHTDGVITLEIIDCKPEDSGKYRCVATNVHGTDETSCVVIVEGKIDVPNETCARTAASYILYDVVFRSLNTIPKRNKCILLSSAATTPTAADRV